MPEIFVESNKPAILPLGIGRRDEFATSVLGQRSPVGAYRLPVLKRGTKEPRVGEMAVRMDGESVTVRSSRGEHIHLSRQDALAQIRPDPEDLADLEDGHTIILREDGALFGRLSANLAERYGVPANARFLCPGRPQVIDANGGVVFQGNLEETIALDYFRALAMNGRMMGGLYLITEDAGALELDVEALPRLGWPAPDPEKVAALLLGMGLGEWQFLPETATLRRVTAGSAINLELLQQNRVRAFGTIPYTLSGDTPGRSFGELPYGEREAALALEQPELAAALVIGQLEIPGVQKAMEAPRIGFSLYVPNSESPLLCAVERIAEQGGATHYVATASHAGARLFTWAGTCPGAVRSRIGLLKEVAPRLLDVTPEGFFRHHWGMMPSEPVSLAATTHADLDRRVRLLHGLASAIGQLTDGTAQKRADPSPSKMDRGAVT